MNITDIAHAIHESGVSSFVRGDEPGTEWVFPIVETLHVIFLALVFGSIALVDLRLLGLGSRQQPFTRVYKELIWWTWWAFLLAAISGSLLATGKIEDYVHSPQVFWKFFLMALAGLNMLLFHFGVFQRVKEWDAMESPPARARLAGALSLACWIGVVFFGRWIGFVT
jgi:putative copper export protein